MKIVDCRNLKMNIVRSIETSATATTKTQCDIPDDLKKHDYKKKHKIRKHYDHNTTITTPWLYSPCRTQDSITTISQSSLLCARILQFLTPARVAPEDQTSFCLYQFPEQCCFFFFRGEVVSLMPKPQPGRPGCLSLSGLYPSTCPAWEALPVATLPPAELSDDRNTNTAQFVSTQIPPTCMQISIHTFNTITRSSPMFL